MNLEKRIQAERELLSFWKRRRNELVHELSEAEKNINSLDELITEMETRLPKEPA